MKKNNFLKHNLILLLVGVLSLFYFSTIFALFDPTQPKTKMKNNKNISLDMIQYNKNGSVAYINGISVKVGDHFSGMKVVAITRDSVTLKNSMEVKVIKLFKGNENESS